MKLFNLRYIYTLAILLLSMSVASAQSVAEYDDEQMPDTVDSLGVDTFEVAPKALPWDQAVRRHLDHLLEHDMFKTSQVGIMVYDLDADSTIYAHGERQLLRPASTMKVLTAIAAIDKLGGSYRFQTELCYTGKVDNNTLHGNVYCVGGFDPRFNIDDMRAFVEGIRKMGVDTIRGNIYADKTMKDADTLGNGWCWDDDNPVLSPLLISRKNVFVERFVRELQEAGIVLDGKTGEARRPEDAFCIVSRFHSIDQILMKMLKESDNLYAESMFYQLGAAAGHQPSTAKNSAAVIDRLIRKVGLDPRRYNIADGSGLSLYNYVSAELEVRFLRYAFQNNNIYLHLHPALPTAGEDGTLRSRQRGTFTQGNVYAKTGTLKGISSLAGYCTAANGHRLAFAIINQGVMNRANGRAFQDRVCTVLCQP
ncbi:D-alanyl-D-alanine carboxypeptidase/D-alanyl-D-alanine-endopeptidase [uncultured Prevotella sp.]|uniref:D-alanyl-D-alanine carboxypeptidase/D-alanyl-D-alanine endopeptidase n=1 Tax=uncultured Prevotella sp. TaxID=159272 RepID=UPI0025E5E40C|nr:D-alanyl-D-alanine carboxypeptidase/D-alanyl-D-alanine-endopeptidase [uncultured Prevotella sp.]